MEFIPVNLFILCLFCLWFLKIISSDSSSKVKINPESENNSLLHTTNDFKVLQMPGRFQNDVTGEALQVGSKTEYTFNDEEIMALVDIHNNYRRNVIPPASDMNYVSWNVELASFADRWAKLCKWEHGYPNMPNGSKPVPLPFGGSIAQNIWRSNSRDPSHLTQAVTDWFNERNYYDYNSATCKSGNVCGHYRIMAFGQLQELGCGSALCPFGIYTVCNYGPSVPVTGVPYKRGPSCAQCQSGEGWCDQGLCTMCATEEANATCSCDLKCHNCGLLDNDTCRCDCKAGWTNTDCSERCVDTRDYCKFYDRTMCADISKAQECPASCNLCEKIDQTTIESKMCCKGELCPAGEVLDDTCHCIVYVPITINSGYLNRSTGFLELVITVMMAVVYFFGRN